MTRSIQQLPNNTTTAQTEAVYTQTGFTAGDAVYYQNGDYVSPTVTPSAFANPTGSLAFTPTFSGPYTASGGIENSVGGVSPIFNGTAASGYSYFGGSRNVPCAKLSNGNLVYVWIQNDKMVTNPGRSYFQILTTTGTQVVAPTLISTAYYNTTASANITVEALPAGGFVVAWVNTVGGTVNKPNYAVYTNAGAVTKAATNESGAPTMGRQSPIKLCALTNGQFVMVVKSSATNQLYYNIFSSGGNTVFGWVAPGYTMAAPFVQFGVAARSDNGGEFIIVDWISATDIFYLVTDYNINTLVASSFTASNMTAVSYGADVACLSDNATFVIGYVGRATSSGSAAASSRTIGSAGSGYALGTEILVPQANLNTGTTTGLNTKFARVLGLSSGNYAFAFPDTGCFIKSVVYTPTGTPLSGTNASGAVPVSIPTSFVADYCSIGMIEHSSGINFYWSPIINYDAASTMNVFTAQISLSTYALVYATNATVNAAVTTTSAASTINLASSTLTNAKYNLVSTLTTTANTSLTTAITTPTTVLGSAVDGVMSTTLTNGNLVICYQRPSGVVDAVIYSPSGVLLQTISGIGTSGGGQWTTKVTALNNNKILVTYSTNNTQVTAVIYSYSTTYTESLRFVVNGVCNNFSQAQNYAVAAISGDLFVVVNPFDTNNGSNVTAHIYSSSSSTEVAVYQLIGGASFGPWGSSTQLMHVIGNNYGGFAVTARAGSTGASYIAWYYQKTATTWGYGTYTGVPNTTGSFWALQGAAYNGAGMYMVINGPGTSNTAHNIYNIVDGYTTNNLMSTLVSISNNSSSFEFSIGITGFGTFVHAELGNSLNVLYGMPAVGSLYNAATPSSAAAFISYPSQGYSTLSSTTAGNSNTYPSIAPGVGGNAWLVYLNSSNYPVFTSLVAWPASVTTTVPNTQVSSTAAVSINPQLNNTSTTISGTILAGVAATTASAGSTGLLVTNGLAQLNSSYPATSAQTFDTTGLPIAGVKGTLKNRTINMQGNS